MTVKKSFVNIPAMQFVSLPESEEPKQKKTHKTDNTQNMHKTHDTAKAQKAHKACNTHSTNDTVNTHNTENGVTTHHTDNTHKTQAVIESKVVQVEHELKTKRLNLLIKPSLFEKLTKIAHMEQTSVNELINSVLSDYTTSKKKTIERYAEVFTMTNSKTLA